jgi:hypothetical protein
MAPSIIESPAAEITVPIKTDPRLADSNPKARVRRVIDEEGGNTTASVRHDQPVDRYLYRKLTQATLVSSLPAHLGLRREIPSP